MLFPGSRLRSKKVDTVLSETKKVARPAFSFLSAFCHVKLPGPVYAKLTKQNISGTCARNARYEITKIPLRTQRHRAAMGWSCRSIIRNYGYEALESAPFLIRNRNVCRMSCRWCTALCGKTISHPRTEKEEAKQVAVELFGSESFTPRNWSRSVSNVCYRVETNKLELTNSFLDIKCRNDGRYRAWGIIQCKGVVELRLVVKRMRRTTKVSSVCLYILP